MCTTAAAARALPVIAAACSAAATVLWLEWMKSRHYAYAHEVFRAGQRSCGH